MARGAILPRNPRDPTGVDRIERACMNDFERRFRMIRNKYISLLDRIPAAPVVNARYEFQLDQYLLASILDEASAYVDTILLQGGFTAPWVFESYVRVAYQRGTAQTLTNLSVQSPVYASARPDLATVLRSEPYQRRIGLIRTRVFEDMKGMSAETKQEMGRVLTEGVARGRNPRDIAKDLTKKAGIETRRGKTIARTEVPMALRRARLDESDDAAASFKLRMLQLHLSALSPTTRATHARRHGKLFTTDQVREWYSVDGNAINCKCAQTEVLVDENGKAVVPSIVERARQNYAIMKNRSDADWAKE